MSWDSWSDVMLIITGGVAVIAFVSGLATLYVGYKSGKVKDARAKAQEERIRELDLKRLEAEQKLLELQERFSPRTIAPANRQRLLETLQQGPVSTVFISFPSHDAEACLFAKQLQSILNEAGWTTEISGVVSFGGSVETGITLVVRVRNLFRPQKLNCHSIYSKIKKSL